MEDPKPTVGRIVIYHLIDNLDVPAVVVAVDPADFDSLSLHVMYPRHKAKEEGPIVMGGCSHLAAVRKGDGIGQWGWPPRMPQL